MSKPNPLHYESRDRRMNHSSHTRGNITLLIATIGLCSTVALALVFWNEKYNFIPSPALILLAPLSLILAVTGVIVAISELRRPRTIPDRLWLGLLLLALDFGCIGWFVLYGLLTPSGNLAGVH